MAQGRFVFNLRKGHGLSSGGQFQTFTGSGALFQLLGQLGGSEVADVLDPKKRNFRILQNGFSKINTSCVEP